MVCEEMSKIDFQDGGWGGHIKPNISGRNTKKRERAKEKTRVGCTVCKKNNNKNKKKQKKKKKRKKKETWACKPRERAK